MLWQNGECATTADVILPEQAERAVLRNIVGHSRGLYLTAYVVKVAAPSLKVPAGTKDGTEVAPGQAASASA